MGYTVSGLSDDDRSGTRRDVLRWAAGGAALAALSGCKTAASQPEPAPLAAPADPSLVRVVSVPTAVEGNVLPDLLARFHESSGLRPELAASDDLYALARAGKADLAVSHYGHKNAEQFVMDGFGEWPRTLFSNQMALLGPKADPAGVRGLEDAGEAFRRIAASRSPYVLNDIDGVRYLTEILWHLAGKPEREGWFIDDRAHRRDDAIAFAAEKSAYVFWGLTPFLRSGSTALEPLVLGDPLLQRMLVSIVVKPSKVSGVNPVGASALQDFLLSPVTQAHIREIRYPGSARVTWVPGGRHNRTAFLPKK